VPDVAALEWVQIHPVTSASLIPIVTDLGAGEAEVIALGLNMTDSLLIIDDRLARRIAGLHNLRYTGTLGILVKANRDGLISSVDAAITALREKGMWLSDTVVEQALRLSGERTQM
jgi:predicted nucleic acid-binding protein